MAVAVVFMVIAGTFAAQGQDSTSGDIEKAVLARLADIENAAQELDPDKVFSFVLENDKGALIQNGRLLLTRADALESTKRGFEGLQKVSYTFYRQHVTVLSPTVALVVSDGSSSFTIDDGRTFMTPFAQTVVFILTGGAWQVLHAHRSFPPAN
jgi:hypothetical protein